MKPYRREARYLSILTVRVSGPQFIDMMRYDCCCPATEEDSNKINKIIVNAANGDWDNMPRIIRFKRYSANPTGATVGRWQSFGCTVLDERSPDAEPLNDEQLLRLAQR